MALRVLADGDGLLDVTFLQVGGCLDDLAKGLLAVVLLDLGDGVLLGLVGSRVTFRVGSEQTRVGLARLGVDVLGLRAERLGGVLRFSDPRWAPAPASSADVRPAFIDGWVAAGQSASMAALRRL